MTRKQDTSLPSSDPASLDAQCVAFPLYKIADAIERGNQIRRERENVNAIVIGHLMVAWAMLVHLLGFFALHTGDRGVREIAVVGIVFAMLGMFAAWLSYSPAANQHAWRCMSAVLVVISWMMALVWAVRVATVG